MFRAARFECYAPLHAEWRHAAPCRQFHDCHAMLIYAMPFRHFAAAICFDDLHATTLRCYDADADAAAMLFACC